MNGQDRTAIVVLVSAMRKIPGKLDALITQVQRLRRVYEGGTEYRTALEQELDELEIAARQVAHSARLIKGLMDDSENLVEIHSILRDAIDES